MAALFLAAALLALPASADEIAFTAELKGTNEVPPNDSTGSGQAEAYLDTDLNKLTWKVTYAGLSGPVIGAHIHGPIDSGGNAGIMLPFHFVASPINQSAELTDGQIDALQKGLWYVNIHTARYPGGEIRGQLLPKK